MRGLYNEYLAGAADLSKFYQAPPQQLFDSPPVSASWHSELVEGIREYQSGIGAGAVFNGDEAVVITGQQPAIFTGPLYTIYKAITTLRAARAITEKHGVPCTPVFWVGSEDHDFEEARSVSFLTKQHQRLSLTYTPQAEVHGLPMYRVPIEDSLHRLVDEAQADTPGSEFSDEIASFLHSSLDESSSLADWCARLLAHLFRDTPLVFFAPHIPAARKLAAPIIEQEIRDPLTVTRLINETANELDRLDFPPQLAKGEQECNFFFEVNTRRCKVIYQNRQFQLPEIGESYSAEELLDSLKAEPGRFSPNVALRCIVQQHLFPTAAYVAGPGEIAYWAQLKPVFAHFGKTMPIVYPRAQCVLKTIKLDKLLTKYSFEVEDLDAPADSLVDQALRNSASNPALEFAHSKRLEIEAEFDRLVEGLEGKEKNVATMARGLKKDMAGKLDRIERAILNGDQAKTEATRKQIERLCVSLMPQRRPQERVYTVFSFLFEHGWDLIPRLMDEIDINSFTMNEIEL